MTTLALDRAGCLWVGAEPGLSRFDPATKQLLVVPLPLRPNEIPKVRTVLHDPRTDHLWVGYGLGTVAVFTATRSQAPIFRA